MCNWTHGPRLDGPRVGVLVDRLQRIDLREVSVIKRIEPEAVGRIRIGSEEWEARTHDRKGIGPGTPIRISPVEGQVMVVTVGT